MGSAGRGRSDVPRCRGMVSDGRMSYQCTRHGVVEDGGKFYCKQHAPNIRKAKRDRSYNIYCAKADIDNCLYEETQAAWRIARAVLGMDADAVPEVLRPFRDNLIAAKEKTAQAKAALEALTGEGQANG